MSQQIIGLEVSNVAFKQLHCLHANHEYIRLRTRRVYPDYDDVNGKYDKINDNWFVKQNDASIRIRRYTGLYASKNGLSIADNSQLWYFEKYRSEWDESGSSLLEILSNGEDPQSKFGVRDGWMILFRQNLATESNLGAQNIPSIFNYGQLNPGAGINYSIFSIYGQIKLWYESSSHFVKKFRC